MGNANAKLWEAVEEADVRTLLEVLKHKEVDIDHRKEYKLGRRNWNQLGAGNGGTGCDESASPSLSSIITSDGTSAGGGGTLSEVKNEMKYMFQGVDKDILTPLHVACMRGNREIVGLLMTHGADIHIKAVHERYGPSSLRAFRKRGRKILKRYEEEGYIDDPQQGATNTTKMHKSAREISHGNTPQRLNARLGVGGGGHQRSFSSTTAASAASVLTPFRLNEDPSGGMHRHASHDDGGLGAAAARGGRPGLGGRQDGGPFEGMDYIKYCQYTALYYACKYRSKEVAFDLLTRHIEDAARMRATRAGSIDAEKAANIEKNLKGLLIKNWGLFIEVLIDHRADFVAALCDAAARGDMEIVELLVGLGANVNGEESETVEKVILERKPSKWDTTTPYEYISREDRPLYIACHNGQREVVEYFLQMGAIVQDEDVSTAIESGFRDIAMLLLEAQTQQGHSRTQQQQDRSHMPATSSPAIEHSIYPVMEPQQPQLPPRIQSPMLDHQQLQQQQQQPGGLYPPQQAFLHSSGSSYAPLTYQQLNSYRGGQQSTPPDSPPPQGSPPSPLFLQAPAQHIPSGARTPDPYSMHHQHHQVMSTSTTPTGSPQLYSSTLPPQQQPPQQQQQQQAQPQPQRPIYGAYTPGLAVNGGGGAVGRPYFAQPQAAYHPSEPQPRASTPQPPPMAAPAAGYYPGQQQQQVAAGPPPSYLQHIAQQQVQQAQAQAQQAQAQVQQAQQAQQQAQQQAASLYQASAMLYTQMVPYGARAVPPVPGAAPPAVYQAAPPPAQPPQQPQPQAYAQPPAPSPHLRLSYPQGPAQGHFVLPSAPPGYMPQAQAQPQGPYGLAPPPVPMHQRKPSESGLSMVQAVAQQQQQIPKSDGAMALSVETSGSSDYIHSEYEVDYNEVELEKELARGSFGIVYTGKWRGTDVAIKKLVNQNLSQKELEEFHSEVNVMKKLHHPNVLLLMGVCSQPPNLCMICELMTGSLWDLLHRRKEVRLDWQLVMRFITDTARGMNYLHLFKPPVLHRDLKTPNLLVDKDFNVKIADFGLARLKAHVMTGNLGTCQYMAPEVLRNESYTESADVYSFGIIVWEIVARAPPFHGMQTMQIAYSVNQGLRPPIPPHCPIPLRDLMQRCWSQDPHQRPSFSAILNQIKTIQL